MTAEGKGDGRNKCKKKKFKNLKSTKHSYQKLKRLNGGGDLCSLMQGHTKKYKNVIKNKINLHVNINSIRKKRKAA